MKHAMGRMPVAIRGKCQRLRGVVFDFDGVFTDNRVLVLEDGREGVLCSRSDGFGLARLRELGLAMTILSTEKNPVVAQRAKKLQIACIHGVDDKEARLKQFARDQDIPLPELAYLGNDINDAGCLKAVGLAVVVADAFPEIRPLADWILTRKGGDAAVREFCDAVWALRQGRGRS